MTDEVKRGADDKPEEQKTDAPLNAPEIIDRYYEYRYRKYKDEYEGYYGKQR